MWALRGRRAALIGVAVLLVALTVYSTVVFATQRQERQTSAAAEDVEEAAEELQQDLVDAEAGQRGYLLTGQRSYLIPYQRGTAAAPGDLDRISRALRTDPAAHADVAEIRTLTAQEIADLARTLDLADAGHHAQALQAVQADTGQHLMVRLREVLHRAADQAHARAEQAAARATTDLARALAGLAATLLLLVLVAVLGAIGRIRRWRHYSQASAEELQDVFASSPLGVAVFPLQVDPVSFTQVNPQLSRLTGYTRQKLLGLDIVRVAHPDEQPAVRENLARIAGGHLHAEVGERRWVHADGHTIWVSITATVTASPDGGRLCIAQVMDITDRKHAEERLTRQAHYDALTDLPNRLLLHAHLERALARTRRHGSRLVVVYIDVDDFKDINDVHGHAAGDHLLTQIAARLRDSLRDSDLAARIGGDEFVLVCEDLPDDADTTAITDRILDALNRPVTHNGRTLTVSASLGVAVDDGTSPVERLIAHADAAMFTAKSHGKARAARADHFTVEHTTRAHTLHGQLRTALEDGQFLLHYQPIVNLADGQIVAVEALLRWAHPQHGLLLPAAFLDIAEHRELIIPIGAWVLGEACRQGATWQTTHLATAPSVAVNLSSHQLTDRAFPALVRRTLDQTGLDPHRLTLELTERQVLNADTAIEKGITAVADTGVQLAIDDFGTGYSTFAYLRRFPFTTLKIDGSFITDVPDNPTDTAIVTALITLGRTLNLTVIGEGIETNPQLTTLHELGCPLGQGFGLHRPNRAEVVDSLISTPVGARPNHAATRA